MMFPPKDVSLSPVVPEIIRFQETVLYTSLCSTEPSQSSIIQTTMVKIFGTQGVLSNDYYFTLLQISQKRLKIEKRHLEARSSRWSTQSC